MASKHTNKKRTKDVAPTPVEGLTATEVGVLEAFVATMNDKVIPEIVRKEEERRVLAASSRHWPLKT